MVETKRFSIRLGDLIEELIEKYRGKINKSEFIKNAILDKCEKESKKKSSQN